ncbi:MAG: flagellar basal body P-ring protein FlgI [Planctomycetota bacterium]|nr:flagellar basal body P-ring protein FlgI [Planctomycetota bacterium]
MRGTIFSEATIVGYANSNSPGYSPLIGQGYGFVVGLNGTGSRDIGPELRAHMLAEMSRGGIGSARIGMRSLSPSAMLDSMDTAVVIVQGVIPQAATTGTRFDVRVTPVSGSSTTSLEGGTLYTTQLTPQLQIGRPSGKGFPLGKARGPIFINPFAEPGAMESSIINRNTGRILNGGSVIDDLPLKLRIFNPSHARAGMLVTAINTRFPQEPGMQDQTARGESDDSIELSVPPSYKNRIDEFIDLLLHTTIRQANPESVAMSIKRILLSNPTLKIAQDSALRWQALGPRALPIIRELYTFPEERPRMAALLAGARLSDPLAVPELTKLARKGSLSIRLQTIRLMKRMALDPNVDQALRTLLNDENVNIRLEAYETLAFRGDPSIRHFPVDEKFYIDIVDSDSAPLVYITEIGLPRIVLFGTDISIKQPMTWQTWSNRIMVTGDSDDEELEVYYRPIKSQQGFISKVNPDLNEFIRFLGHTSTIERPEPGLGLSYGETVGLIYQICRSEYVKADFRAQQDRIQAAIAAIQEDEILLERPDFADSDNDRFLPSPEEAMSTGQSGQASGRPLSSTGGE